MEPREAALLSSILHLPAGITITSVHPGTTELIIRVACHAPSMLCPECHQPSTRIHGNYERMVADLPFVQTAPYCCCSPCANLSVAS